MRASAGAGFRPTCEARGQWTKHSWWVAVAVADTDTRATIGPPWLCYTTATYSTLQYHYRNTNTSACLGTTFPILQIDHLHLSIPPLPLLLPRSNVGPLRESLQIP